MRLLFLIATLVTVASFKMNARFNRMTKSKINMAADGLKIDMAGKV